MFHNVFAESEDEKFVDAWKNKNDHSLCVTEGGTVVAFAVVCGRYLDYIVTDEIMQGKGYGTLLLNEIVHRVPTLYLTTAYDEDEALKEWYESKGFYLSSTPEKDVYVMVHRWKTRQLVV